MPSTAHPPYWGMTLQSGSRGPDVALIQRWLNAARRRWNVIRPVAVLLDKSGCLKEYFSPFELRQMHDHLAALSRQPEGRNIQDMIDYVTIFMTLPAVGAAVSAGC